MKPSESSPLPTNYLGVFDHFVGSSLKWLAQNFSLIWKQFFNTISKCFSENKCKVFQICWTFLVLHFLFAVLTIMILKANLWS